MDGIHNTPEQKPKAYDPGWNDPPPLSYNAQQPTPSRPRNFLNKRVAFPLSNTGASPSQPAQCNLPPMPTIPLIPSTVPIMPSLPPKTEEISIDSENALREVKDILIKFLESSSELGPKANDIKRRLDMMEEMWRTNKLNKNVQLQMMELACALRDDVPSKADDIHRALMVDHVSAVGTWMPGVKQLIHHCIALSELLAIDKEQSSED